MLVASVPYVYPRRGQSYAQNPMTQVPVTRLRRLGPALEARDFPLWWLALLGMGVSMQMLEVAIGWEVYALHRSALDLGWIGLAEFIPMFVLALPAGQLADRFPRRLIFGARCC